jgi:hypothetical protein
MSQLALETADVDVIVQSILRNYPQDHLQSWAEKNKYIRYQRDPIGFGESILKENYTEDIKIMMESVRDNVTTVSISCNSSGKSYTAASLALWHCMCFPNSLTVTLAAPPERNLKAILWGEIAKKFYRHKDTLFQGYVYNIMDLSSPHGSNITGVTIPQSGPPEEREARVSGRHAPYLMFICDEADGIPEPVFKGIEACMSGGEIRLLCMFNPRRSAGSVYRMIRDGRANVVHLTAFNHPNVKTGQNLIPGAVTRDITVKRINECTVPLPSHQEPDGFCFEVPEFLAGSIAVDNNNREFPPLPAGWRKVKDQEPQFFYQVLGQYPPTGEHQLIQKDWVDAARNRWDLYTAKFGDEPPLGIRPLLGLDVADMGEDSSCLCMRYGNWVAPLIKWKGLDPSDSADRTAEIAKVRKSANVFVDSIGVGASVAPLLRKKGIKATRIMVSERPISNPREERRTDKEQLKHKFNKLRDELWWKTREWFESGEAMIPPDEQLMEELLIMTYSEHPVTGRLVVLPKDKIREALNRSSDAADSLVLTMATKPPPPRVRVI